MHLYHTETVYIYVYSVQTRTFDATTRGSRSRRYNFLKQSDCAFQVISARSDKQLQILHRVIAKHFVRLTTNNQLHLRSGVTS